MTEFSTGASLELTVPQSELRSARQEIETELGDIEVQVTGSAGASMLSDGGPNRSLGSGRAVAADIESLSTLADERNELLADLVDAVEAGGGVVGGAGGGGGGRGLLSFGGGAAGGALGGAGLGAAGIAGLGAALVGGLSLGINAAGNAASDTRLGRANRGLDTVFQGNPGQPFLVGAGSAAATRPGFGAFGTLSRGAAAAGNLRRAGAFESLGQLARNRLVESVAGPNALAGRGGGVPPLSTEGNPFRGSFGGVSPGQISSLVQRAATNQTARTGSRPTGPVNVTVNNTITVQGVGGGAGGVNIERAVTEAISDLDQQVQRAVEQSVLSDIENAVSGAVSSSPFNF